MMRALCSAFALLAVSAPSRVIAQTRAPASAEPAAAGAAPKPAAPLTPPATQPPPPPAPAQGSASAPAEPPGPYYLEPPGSSAAAGGEPSAPSSSSSVVEPAPPRYAPMVIFEPPPPPPPRHVAPRTSLWLGARLGWFFPFGNVYARRVQVGNFVEERGVPWRDYATSGPMFELDIGARLARNYNLFGLWERAELGAGHGDDGLLGSTVATTGGDSDFWAVGVRASSDPDRVGFSSEIALGYRRARSQWDDGSTLELTQGLFEARLGFGADIRVNPKFSLSPMLTFGVGMFGSVELVDPDGRAANVIRPEDDEDGHAFISLQMGGHFDLRGGR